MIKKNNKGFTLIELLVGLAVFSTFLVLSIDLFLTINRVQRETEISERILSENRFVMETTARLVRGGKVDYAAYGDPLTPIANPVDELILEYKGEQVRIKSDSTFCPTTESSPCVLISRDGGTSWSSMTPKGTKVVNLRFYIMPNLDPFRFTAGGYLSDDQPMVTIVFGIGSTNEISNKYIEVNNQTTVSIRKYAR